MGAPSLPAERRHWTEHVTLALLAMLVLAVPPAYLTNAFDVFGAAKVVLVRLVACGLVALQGGRAVSLRPLKFPSLAFLLVVLAFLGSVLLSTAFSLNPALSLFGARRRFLGAGTYAALAVIALAPASVTWTRRRLAWLAGCMTLGAIAVSVVGLAQYAGSGWPLDLTQRFGGRAYATLGNPDYLAVYLALVLPFTLYLALDRRHHAAGRLLGFTGFPLAVFALLTSRSLGGLLAAVMAIAVFLLVRAWPLALDRRLRVALAALSVVGGALLAMHLWRSEAEAVSSRAWAWKATMQVIARDPVTGTGLEALRFGLQQLRLPPPQPWTGASWEDAHNLVLNLAATTGLPGLAGFLGLVFLAAAGARRLGEDSELSAAVAPLAASITGYLTAVQFNPEDIGSAPIFWMVLGLCVSLGGSRAWSAEPPPAASRVAGVAVMLVAVAAAWLSTYPVVAEVHLLKANNAPDISAAVAHFRAAQRAQAHEPAYHIFETLRLAGSLDDLTGPAGQEVLAAARRAIRLNELDAENWMVLGGLYSVVGGKMADRGLRQDALRALRRAVALDPYNERAITLLASTYAGLGDRRQARRWIKLHNRYFGTSADLAETERRLRTMGE